MFIATLQNLLAPPLCSGCGRLGAQWCASCDSIRADPQVRHLGMAVHTLFAFSGPVRRTIIDWKDEQRTAARRRVVDWFRFGLEPLLLAAPDTQLVPVPSSPRSNRRRGGDVLADAIRLAAPHARVADSLIASRARNDQSELNRAQRVVNVSASMQWRGDGQRPVIIVDDIVTTGATLLECARAARAAGVEVLGAFAIAHRERAGTVAPGAAGLR